MTTDWTAGLDGVQVPEPEAAAVTHRRLARPRPTEATLRSKVRAAALKLGVMSAQFDTKIDAGLPDRIFFCPGGRPLLIEFKRPGETPTPLQAYKIQQLRGLGYDVFVVDTYADAMALIEARTPTPDPHCGTQDGVEAPARVVAVRASTPP